MYLPDIFELHGCVNSSSRAAYDSAIPKVVLKGVVIGEEQARTADSGQRENVFVVGTTDALGLKCLGL